jgi:hypothetical protein
VEQPPHTVDQVAALLATTGDQGIRAELRDAALGGGRG